MALSIAKWHPMREYRGSAIADDCGLCVEFGTWEAEGYFEGCGAYCPYYAHIEGPCFEQLCWTTWTMGQNIVYGRLYNIPELAEPIYQQLLQIYWKEMGEDK